MDELNHQQPEETGYTTVLKLLQIMTEKRLVRRDEAARSHVYEAAQPEEATQQQLVRHLLDRAFGGAAHKLVMQALTAQSAGTDELAEIRRLLDRMQKERSRR
jgi:predicted transcriptional regulator